MHLDELAGKIISSGSLDLLSVLPNGTINTFYKDLVSSNVFVINVDQTQTVPTNGEPIQSLRVLGTTSALGFDNINIDILFEEEFQAIKSTLIMHFLQNKLSFPNFSHFSIGDLALGVTIWDAAVPLVGSISGTIDILTELRLTLDYPVANNEWLFIGAFVEPKGLLDLIDFTGGANLSESLPGFLKNTLDFKVSDVGVLYDTESSSLKSISLRAANHSLNVEVLPSVFLSDITLSAAVTYPSSQDGNPPVYYLVSGQIQIGDDKQLLKNGRLLVSAGGPDFQLSGRLDDDSQIGITELIGYYLTPPNNFPEIDITALVFSAYPSQGNYSFTASIGADWKFLLSDSDTTKFIALKQTAFTIEKSSESVSGSANALITISDVDITIFAAYNGTDKSWTFSGSTGPNQTIPIGQLIQDLAENFTQITLPSAIADLTIENLSVSFNTSTKNFTFTGEAKFPIDDQRADIVVKIDLTHNGTSYTNTIGGMLIIGALNFDLYFVQKNTSSIFVATYSHSSSTQSVKLQDLIAYASSDLARQIPDSLTLELKDVLFAFNKVGNVNKFLFGLDIGTHIKLSDLPLIGHEFSSDQTVGVDDLQLLIASADLIADDAIAFNALFPDGVTKLPVKPPTNGSGDTSSNVQPASTTVLTRGITVSATMNFGNAVTQLALPIGASTTQNSTGPSTNAPPIAPAVDNAKWFPLQKAFGPVYFNRVGVKYEDAVLWFLLDAALSAAGLTLTLDGLAFGSPLSAFHPEFDLKGLGIDYKSGPAEIGGAFLRTKAKLTDGTPYDAYDGAAVIKTEALTLSALGSYAVVKGDPSLFIYAVLDYPIGGPSFFFITGLAAGFGYNRTILVPPVDQVATFPLVSAAVNGDAPPQTNADLTTALQKLGQYIKVEPGEIFFAIGIKFTSFKMIDSFVLVTVAFGNEFEIDVLGLSTLVLPARIPGAETAVPPLAVVQMALKASIVPAQGFFGISAQLTSASYVLSPDCHLTGGFAFYAWFSGDHSGDFVQTLGGYHPSFVAPPHYPRVPRLGVNWQVSKELSVKGEAYCALTPSLLMAGLHLQATWNGGSLKAWFNGSADFLIGWKPFHYDASLHIDIGGSYTFEFIGTHQISFDVGADLHIWGPSFAGTAHVNLDIVSFDFSFGDASSKAPEPIKWDVFKQSFLPDDSAICGITVKSGLLIKNSQDSADLGVIIPKTFSLVINSIIPTNHAHIHNDMTVTQFYYVDSDGQLTIAPFSADSNGTIVQLPPSGAKLKTTGTFGIAPMQVDYGTVESTQTITITRDGTNVEYEFQYVPILKNVPIGMWGDSPKSDLNGSRFITDTLAGFEISPAIPAKPGATAAIALSSLQYAVESVDNAFDWANDVAAFQADTLTEAVRRQKIIDSMAQSNPVSARQALFASLGIDPASVDLSDAIVSTIAREFVIAPEIKKS